MRNKGIAGDRALDRFLVSVSGSENPPAPAMLGIRNPSADYESRIFPHNAL